MKSNLAVLPDTTFLNTVHQHDLDLSRRKLKTLQVNVGKLCNQACLHCHVEAGPKRTEIMTAETATRLIELVKKSSTIEVVDITGGAPEMCPEFKRLIRECHALGIETIDRCNLTVFFEPGYQDIPDFLAENKVTVIASLPCYSKENVEKQRGRGVFQKSIDALRLLNSLGYGQSYSKLNLHLVYNPLGPSLPPDQQKLEQDYKHRLKIDFGITFNNLFTITNMPIKRFLHDLEKQGKYEQYMSLLTQSFNPDAANEIMCRDLISIGWDGKIFDCDFNQMLELPLAGKQTSIWDIDTFNDVAQGDICFGDHCYGCTAGAGSSCTGTLSRSEIRT